MRADERGEGTDVDARLDAALRSYAEPGEIAETRVAVARVLERVRSDSGREVGFWVWGAVATACLVVAVVVGSGGGGLPTFDVERLNRRTTPPCRAEQHRATEWGTRSIAEAGGVSDAAAADGGGAGAGGVCRTGDT
jgi:hypothetical protein